MHINAICPHCEARFRLEPAMCGKRMRCPTCRAIFEVRDADEAAPPAVPQAAPPAAPSPRQVTGSVGDIVPILSAEQAEPVAAPRAAAPFVPPPPVRTPAASMPAKLPMLAAEAAPPPRELPKKEPRPAWQEPPPVRKGAAVEAEPRPVAPQPSGPAAELPTAPALDWGPLGAFFDAEPAPSSPPAAPETNGPVAEPAGSSVLAAGAWEAPPVRVPGLSSTAPRAAPVALAPRPSSPATVRRRVWQYIGILTMLLAALGGVLFWQYQQRVTGNEAERFAQAEERYNNGNFEDAIPRLQKLIADFPDSPNLPLYRFLAELCGLREPVYSPQLDADDARNALGRLQVFVASYKDNPLLTRYEGDLWDTYFRLAEKLTALAAEKHDRDLRNHARIALEQARGLKPPVSVPAEAKLRAADNKLVAVLQDIAAVELKQGVLAQVKKVVDHFSFPAMQQVKELVQEKGLSADPDVGKLLAELPAKHRASVHYTAAPAGKAERPPLEEQEPSLLIVPAVKPRLGEVEADARVLLGMARGVLYALEPGRGDVRWARRVSIDAAALPLRLPRTPIAPELVLALAPDSYTLTALDAQRGTVVWRHRLKAACLGNPVIVDNRALVPTDQGLVEEIETTAGTLLGYYTLGQPLTVGGVRQPGTNLVYFPADRHSVYVLDVAGRSCAGILYSGHPEGSLRGAPIILQAPARPGANQAGRTSLLLSEEADLDKVKLRVFPLPITDPEPGKRQRELDLSGWSWFPPYVDAERLAQVADTGRFFLYGIEPGDANGLTFFPMVKDEVLLGGGSGRAQVVHADAERFWVLADGWLRKLVLTFDRQDGPHLVPRQLGPDPLGSAVHASQVRTGADNKTTLFLVTQARDGHTCLASAIDARSGTAYWQRQLGLVCQGQPTRLGSQVLVQEQGGSLYLFDAPRLKGRPNAWQQAGRKVADALSNHVGPVHFLAGPDGASLYVVATTRPAPPKLPTLVVQVFHVGKDAPTTRAYPEQGLLAGTPGLGADALVLPLANGILVRQALEGGPAVAGPNWRAAHAEVEAVGHVVALGSDDFVVTDGSRGLQRLHWPAGNMAQARASAELANRIVAAPVVLSPDASGEVRLCVADAANTLTLLQGEGLRTVRQWPQSGQITAGPFVRGKGLGCVVERRRLVWLDPDRDQPAWEYTFAADLVGEPQWIDGDLLVVADLSGTFTGFNPITGQMAGPGYTLRANVAPAAAPVAFGPRRLFAPLTDGTVLLLSRKYFQHPLLRMPSVW